MRGDPILIVDDDHLFTEVIAEVLRDEGYGVELAGDGDEALAVLRRVTPSLIVLDLRLPGRSGAEVFRRVRGEGWPTAIILTSAGLDLDATAATLGPEATLAKPFDLDDLLALV